MMLQKNRGDIETYQNDKRGCSNNAGCCKDINTSSYFFCRHLVVIDGAEKATTLYYTGNGEFFDAVTQDLYPVIAWEELPGVPDRIENKSEETGKEEYFSDKEYEKKQLFDVSLMIGCLIIRWITKYYIVSLICDCFMVIVIIDFWTNKIIYQQRKKRK